MINDDLDHAEVYCENCRETMLVSWESGNPKWMARAIAKATEAHSDRSADCLAASLKVHLYKPGYGPHTF